MVVTLDSLYPSQPPGLFTEETSLAGVVVGFLCIEGGTTGLISSPRKLKIGQGLMGVISEDSELVI